MSTTTFTSTATTTSSATATCTTAVPGKYGRVPVDACNANYFFDPSFAANLAFCVLFGMTTMVHLIQAILFKKKFCWVAIMGAAWETIGFAFKTLGSRNQQNMTYLIWGQLFFLLAPLWINAFVYMAVARMVYFRMPDRKLLGIKAIRMTLLFVWLDIILFLVQGAGGSMLSNNDDMNVIRIGQKLYMAGVGLQLAVIVIFIGITAPSLYFKLRQLEGRKETSGEDYRTSSLGWHPATKKKMEKKQAKEAKKARKAGAQELKNLSYEGQSNSSNELV
ncbi:hypothetical protein FOXG_08448 [Fusarium oxysporum f. sp. lycopersici 4287]|uniref:Uncharacterized protein n=1 Tax=Fusarium oxysporum f. sp. lycopersici (strain 4287 / CBS 123668 / FGSC 9935 / NRRL 34936) TaxID=426428 RepID=A0A0J9V8H3_FUSO4|nr:hypothetical protein FOXG_08448 [Fusarium oxysporum f. sp. lycopersici 4287]KNB07191.1 hypothetical protein FOXG_08448 [Fusarium oxysporum f. sp. lycopersici 4287]